MSKVTLGVIGGVLAVGVAVYFLVREDKAAPPSAVIAEPRTVPSTAASSPAAVVQIEAPPPPAPTPPPPAPMPRSELASTSPAPLPLPKQVIDFSQRTDSDPVLSRELEYAIQKSIDAQPRTNGYEVQSLKCRAAECLIFTVDRLATQEGKWSSALGNTFGTLSNAAIRHPGTGVQLQPSLQGIAQVGGGGTVTVLQFKSQ